jgi:hypothetical protein
VTRIAPSAITAYLGAVLALSKSLGALLYGTVLVPLVRFTTPRLQFRVAIAFASIALAYPMLRAVDLVPVETMIDVARSVSQERADSLKTRFDQEAALLEHAAKRWSFGWGRFGRSRVYDEESGKDITIQDGEWIITIGVHGLFGYLAEFGLLALAVFRAASAFKFIEAAHDRVNLAALTLILAINMIDLLPNASITSWTWLLAGALVGRAEALRSAPRSDMAAYYSPKMNVRPADQTSTTMQQRIEPRAFRRRSSGKPSNRRP